MTENKPVIAAIVAMAQNRVIGRDNALPWHIPADLKYFKAVTMGKPMIMGRKCYDSLGRPLPGRANIVISRTQNAPPINENGPFYVASLEAALKEAGKTASQDIMIIGGGEIYRQAMPLVQRLYLTLVHRDYEGDVFFPDFSWDDWRIVSQEGHDGEPEFTFFTLEKK